jgi:hypothetical protein
MAQMGDDAAWGGAHAPGPRVALFSWGPGDSLVVTAGDGEQPAHAPARPGTADAVPQMPLGGAEVHEYRLHKPGGLWRHQRYVQRPFQLFYAEAQNVWSESIRETIKIGMDESRVEERRDLLCDETLQYKVALCLTRVPQPVLLPLERITYLRPSSHAHVCVCSVPQALYGTLLKRVFE